MHTVAVTGHCISVEQAVAAAAALARDGLVALNDATALTEVDSSPGR